MDKLKTDKRLCWVGPAEIPEDIQFIDRGIDVAEWTHERILEQLSNNATAITKITDRLMIAKRMADDGQDSEENQKLMAVLNEELIQWYDDREILYRIDAMRELLGSL